jgi:hypothetical protein
VLCTKNLYCLLKAIRMVCFSNSEGNCLVCGGAEREKLQCTAGVECTAGVYSWQIKPSGQISFRSD